MAKSSRSKWKKAHRRQKAAEESKNVERRLKQLNKKLKLTAKGGISAVAPQAPERRFHFLNPELDPRVPNTSKDLNNNYRAELNHVAYDYNKPLKLAPPKSTFYGKSDPDAPHPMTVNFETLDADAPIAGRAMTKADLERLAAKQQELQALATRLEGGNEEEGGSTFKISSLRSAASKQQQGRRGGKKKGGNDDDEEQIISFDNDPALNGGAEDGPEEFVLSLDGSKPVKVSHSASSGTGGKSEGNKIASMTAQSTRRGEVVATGGSKKVKQITKAAVKTSRMTSSTGKKTKAKKVIMD